MNSNYPPPSGDPQDHQPTEQFWAMNSPAAGNQDSYGHGHSAQRPPGAGEYFARDRRKARHWTIGITVGAILAAGGVIAGLTLSGNSSYVATGPTGPAAALNATLSSADSPTVLSAAPASTSTASSASVAGPAATVAQRCAQRAAAAKAAGHPRAATFIATHCGARLRLARLLGGVDGQFTFKTKTGFTTLAYERGTIESVASGSTIVVRASDGTTWTWELVSNTVVREKGTKTAESALAPGQTVWVGGPVNSGAKDARLIVIRPPASSSSPSPSGSPSFPPSGSAS
jgi:hypothetical protein